MKEQVQLLGARTITFGRDAPKATCVAFLVPKCTDGTHTFCRVRAPVLACGYRSDIFYATKSFNGEE